MKIKRGQRFRYLSSAKFIIEFLKKEAGDASCANHLCKVIATDGGYIIGEKLNICGQPIISYKKLFGQEKE